MEDGLLSLKWNNHKSTFFQVLSILREKHTYTDVTLACDGQLYQAHKFVLSTCSEYFRDIFTSTNGTSIVIVLKDVRRQDLEYLMDYMYLGQVDVAQSELPSLIKTAECLKIKGLAIPDDEPHKTQRRGADDREGSSPPSKKKRYLHEDDRPSASSSISTSTIINNNTAITSSSSTSASGRLQMEMLPPPPDIGSLVQHLRQVPHSQQPLQASPQPSPTSQGSGKSHSSQPLLLNLTTQASRTSQGGSSGSHTLTPTSTGAQSSHRPLASPSHTTPVPVIKEEAADPPETPEGYLNESFEENETKPDVSDPRHLDPDGAVPGPSGLQGSVDNWDGDGEMGGYGGGDSYPEGSLEEQGESEVQGRSDATTGSGSRQRDSVESLDPLDITTAPPKHLSSQNNEDVTQLSSLSVNPFRKAWWCPGDAFSMVGQNNIMNLIPMDETSRKKIIQVSNISRESREGVEESMNNINTSPNSNSNSYPNPNPQETPEEGGRLSHLGPAGRLEKPNPNPTTCGKLTYSHQNIVVNLASFSSTTTSSDKPVGTSSFSLSSFSSSKSSYSSVSDGGESSVSEIHVSPNSIDLTSGQPDSSLDPLKIITLSPSQLHHPIVTTSSSSQLQLSKILSPSPSPQSSQTLTAESPFCLDIHTTPLPQSNISSPPSSPLQLSSQKPQSLRATTSQSPSSRPSRPRKTSSSLSSPYLAKPHTSSQRQPHSTPPQQQKSYPRMVRILKRVQPVNSIASDTTISTRATTKTTTTYQTKPCYVLVRKLLVCPQCTLVLPNAKNFKKHIRSCQSKLLMDVKRIPDHNYCLHV